MIKSVRICLLVCDLRKGGGTVHDPRAVIVTQSEADTFPRTFDIVGHYFYKVSPSYTSPFSHNHSHLFSFNSHSDNKFP